MDRIIFFDIDKTIFNREGYLADFDKVLYSEFDLSEEDIEIIGDLYDQTKKEYGYFSSEAYLAKIYEKFPRLSGKMNYFFTSSNMEKYLFSDSSVLSSIKDARLGIFSMGDLVLQKAKIEKYLDLFEEDLIYIFHDKLSEVPRVMEEHKDSQLFFVDDHMDVLISAKEIDESVKTILIDREKESEDLNGIDFRIYSLFDIISILNEKNT